MAFDSGFSLGDFGDALSLDYSPRGDQLTTFFFDLSVQEKVRSLELIRHNIRTTKEAFLKQYSDVNDGIESMIRNLSFGVQAREQELKTHLQEIGSAKILSLDRQLKICSEALVWLRDISPSKSKDFQVTWNSFARDIDFTCAGELKFEPGEGTVLKSLKNLGKITCRDESFPMGHRLNNFNVPKFIIGGNREESGKFCRLWGVCSDSTGRILVSDRSKHRIQVFTEKGEFIFEFGKEGADAGEFCRPTGVAVDKKFRIIVADKDNHRIQVFTYNGRFIFKFGKLGRGVGEFRYPWSIAVNEHCDIAVADSKNRRIQLFDEQGVYLAHVGFRDLAENLVERYPRGLAYRLDGSLLVTDFNSHNVLIIDKEFTGMTTFEAEGGKPLSFLRPQGIACHKNGTFVVADCKSHKIHVFDNEGDLVKIFGGHGSNPGEFDYPQGVAFLPNGSIIVADFGNKRVQVF